MKKIVFLFLAATGLFYLSCEKDEMVSNIEVEGYWNVVDDPTFTNSAPNASADLYHLFRGEHAFYRLSFPKTHDFTNLSAKPRPDSLIGFYQIKGNALMIPNPAPSFSNNVPENILISRTDNEMVFTRYIIVRRSLLDGTIIEDRVDTIRYIRVTDPAKISYFDNFLKTYHK
jgi:hypothetical protein